MILIMSMMTTSTLITIEMSIVLVVLSLHAITSNHYAVSLLFGPSVAIVVPVFVSVPHHFLLLV